VKRTFEDAVRQLVRSIRSPRSENLDPDDFSLIRHTLTKVVGAMRLLRPDQVDDVVAQSLAEFVAAAKAGRVDEDRSPALLVTIAKRRTVDQGRWNARHDAELNADDDDLGALDDEAVIRLFDASASFSCFEQAMEAALADGKVQEAQIVRIWVDLAFLTGRAPSQRMVAEKAGVSHPTVGRALDTFKTYFPDDC
jgi:hypothetical protein